MGLEHRFNRIGETFDCGAGTRALGRQQDQPAVTVTARETLGRERTEILDVARDHRSALRGGDLEDDPVAARSQIVPLGYRDNVVATPAQQRSDLR